MQTLWNSRDTLPAYPPLREDLHADAAVVGGGMAGILTAYALHTRGLRVVLLESGRLASGVTAHTTAKITAQHGLFCSGADFDATFGLMHTVEKAAAVYAQARLLNGGSDAFPNTIPDAGLRAIAETYHLPINGEFLEG